MRVINIQNTYFAKKNSGLKTKKVPNLKNKCEKLPCGENLVQNSKLFAYPHFLGTIYPAPDCKTARRTIIYSTYNNVDDAVKNEDDAGVNDIPQDISDLLNKAEEIKKPLLSILDSSKNVYKYGTDTLWESFTDIPIGTASARSSFGKVDSNGALVKKINFNSDNSAVIRDYSNNAIIYLDNKDADEKNFTVFLKCSDIDNPDIISAEKSYTFTSGLLSRYCVSPRKELDANRFLAKEAYTFKNKQFTGYDKSLTIAAGAEYSNSYFRFVLKPGAHYKQVDDKCYPVRYFENKVSVNGNVYYSSREISLLEYLKS